MRSFLRIAFLSACCLPGLTLIAQEESPVNYMSQIYKSEQMVAQKYVSYMSAISHGKNAKKSDRKREDLLTTIDEARMKVNDLPSFQNDKSLRDASVSYLKIMHSVMSEDYGKIVDMEEISEQSYDMMEAYLTAQQKADEKLDEASHTRDEAGKQFAANHKVTLVDSKDALSEKMKKIGDVNQYYNPLYLIFFKASKQESYLTEAVKSKNVNNIEQNKNALIKYSTEGLSALDTMKGFESDRSILLSCKRALEFFKLEASTKINIVTDYYIKSDDFDKLKKTMDSKSAKDRTKEDVNSYNKAVDDINKAVKVFNQTGEYLNQRRTEVYNDWNTSVQTFFDNHMPYAAG